MYPKDGSPYLTVFSVLVRAKGCAAWPVEGIDWPQIDQGCFNLRILHNFLFHGWIFGMRNRNGNQLILRIWRPFWDKPKEWISYKQKTMICRLCRLCIPGWWHMKYSWSSPWKLETGEHFFCRGNVRRLRARSDSAPWLYGDIFKGILEGPLCWICPTNVVGGGTRPPSLWIRVLLSKCEVCDHLQESKLSNGGILFMSYSSCLFQQEVTQRVCMPSHHVQVSTCIYMKICQRYLSHVYLHIYTPHQYHYDYIVLFWILKV